MIRLQVQSLGDQVVVVLDEAARAALGVKVGDTVQVQPPEDASAAEASELGHDGRHERGRAFLRRYQKQLHETGA